jgi:hypothetical protein
MKINFTFLLLNILTCFLCSCSANSTKPNEASSEPRSKFATTQGGGQSCEVAYQAALKTIGTVDISKTTEICHNATLAACADYVHAHTVAPGDREEGFMGAVCELYASYGSNKAANGGYATSKCATAYDATIKLTTVADLKQAANVCSSEESIACDKYVRAKETGQVIDRAHATSRCALNAAHGAYVEVINKQ